MGVGGRGRRIRGRLTAVFGAIILVVVLVFVLPVSFLMSGGLASALIGYFLKDDAEQRHAGSELIELNR